MEGDNPEELAKLGLNFMELFEYEKALECLKRSARIYISWLEKPDGPSIDRKRINEIVNFIFSKAEVCEKTLAGKVMNQTQPNRPLIVQKQTQPSAPAPRVSPSPSLSSQGLDSMIENEILDRSPSIRWDDIAGLAEAKQALREAIILPGEYPHVFTGLRAPPKGLLLFGPPGTGKTMLAKAVATESRATFFNITSSTLTSKFFGEAEKLVRALFEVARRRQPSVIFIDEIDSILGARSEGQHEASRRLETEFLAQMDGVANGAEERVVLIGATNRPQELDEAVIRRMPKRIYIPLPDPDSRASLIRHLLQSHPVQLSESEFAYLVRATDGYSGSDLSALCKEAAMAGIRNVTAEILRAGQVPEITKGDFDTAIAMIRPSVSRQSLDFYHRWNAEHGSR